VADGDRGGRDRGGGAGGLEGRAPVVVVPVQTVGRGRGGRNRAVVVALIVSAASVVGVAVVGRESVAPGVRTGLVDESSVSGALATAEVPARSAVASVVAVATSTRRGVPPWVRGRQARWWLVTGPVRSLENGPTLGEDGLIGGIVFGTALHGAEAVGAGAGAVGAGAVGAGAGGAGAGGAVEGGPLDAGVEVR
jgi:hypothetical protein